MTNQESKTMKGLKKEVNKLKAIIDRRDNKIEGHERHEHYLEGVISGLEESNIKLESKCIFLQKKNIDREMLT